MEATPRMMLPKLSNSEPRNFASPDNVQSSKSESLNQNDQQSYGLLPRIYMSQIADVVAAISSAISSGLASLVPSIVTSITTTSTTFTDTVTDSITNTATFILSGCKPPGFTFDTCWNKRWLHKMSTWTVFYLTWITYLSLNPAQTKQDYIYSDMYDI